MAEYIDRDAALGIVNGWREQLIPTYGKNDEYVKCLETVAEHLETLPAADVAERKIGKWILPNNEVAVYLNEWICSACNNLIDGKHNYCPNCGAQMIGGDDDV